MSKKFGPLKAASAAFAGLLTLSGGLAAAGALPGQTASISTTVSDQTQDIQDTPVPAVDAPAPTTIQHDDQGEDVDEIGDTDANDAHEVEAADDDADDAHEVDVTDDDADETHPTTPPVVVTDPAPPAPAPVGGDQSDDHDGDSPTTTTAGHPANHGADVSAVAHDKSQDKAQGEGNHGSAVSAVAHDTSDDQGQDGNDDHVSTPPTTGTPASVSDDDDQAEEHEADDHESDDVDQAEDAGSEHHDAPRTDDQRHHDGEDD